MNQNQTKQTISLNITTLNIFKHNLAIIRLYRIVECREIMPNCTATHHSCDPLLGFTFTTEPRAFRYLNNPVASYKNNRASKMTAESVGWLVFSLIFTLMHCHITTMTITINQRVFVPTTLVRAYTTTSNHGFYHFVESKSPTQIIELAI